MVKEETIYTYFCDMCGGKIEGTVYSPFWGEMDTDGDGSYDRDGNIISVDICEKCRKDAEQMISGMFSRYKEAANDGSQAKVNNGNRDGYESKPKDELVQELAQELAQMDKEGDEPIPRKGAKPIQVDIFKIMELHNAGVSNAKIAQELGVSTATIQRRVSEVIRSREDDQD